MNGNKQLSFISKSAVYLTWKVFYNPLPLDINFACCKINSSSSLRHGTVDSYAVGQQAVLCTDLMYRPCGYPLLGTFYVSICDWLNEHSATYMYMAVMEFNVVNKASTPGRNPSCDISIVVQFNSKPCLLVEYKPSINSTFYLIDVSHLVEMTVQGYYCTRYYELSICLHCLTDNGPFSLFPTKVQREIRVPSSL